jgi:hypothetical protein
MTHERSRTCSVKVAAWEFANISCISTPRNGSGSGCMSLAAIRELVLDDQQRPSAICWHVFDD